MAARARREVREHFEARDAYSPESAVGFDPRSPLHQRQLDYLIGRGIARPTGEGRYWLDRDAMRREEERRRAALKLVLIMIVVGIAIAIAIGIAVAAGVFVATTG